nr:ribonuclease H-like domain-containing protein [Tanacetum cinerariifolium]
MTGADAPNTVLPSDELLAKLSSTDELLAKLLGRLGLSDTKNATASPTNTMTPSPIPHTFLVSHYTWHQRLGHPGSKVLCRLVSSNFISCNKEKPPVLCHACQVAKHVRLPFVSSTTVISSCFDIIHSDKKYDIEILDRAHVDNCNSSQTPIDTESKLRSDGDPNSDPTLYRSLAGSLQYLTFTQPNISYAVQQMCLYMHDPREPCFSALKRIMRYVRGTLNYGLQLFFSSTTDLVAYSDADWADFHTTRRSTSEVEYHSVANFVAETFWLRNLLRELHSSLSFATLVCCDNVRVLHVPSRNQFADIFTKGLPLALFEEFRSSLSIRCPPALTAGEC